MEDMNNLGRLVPITGLKVGEAVVPTCNGRELHAYLEGKRDYTNWMKGRITKYGFTEGTDFVAEAAQDYCSPNLASKPTRGGHNAIDYHLTLDMAKELAMVENNPMGRQVRRYFIECEKRGIAAQATEPAPLVERPWRERPLEERMADLRLIAQIGRHGNSALAFWYMSAQAKVADFPRHLLSSWQRDLALDHPPTNQVTVIMPSGRA